MADTTTIAPPAPSSAGPAGYRRIYGLGIFLASQLLSQATAVVRSLIVPNLLGPAGYGLVATVNTVDRYTPYVNAGAHYWIINRLPVVDDGDARATVVNTIFAFTLVTSILGALAFLAVALFQWSSHGLVVGYGVAALALNPLASGVWRIHTSLMRVDERVPLMTRLTNVQTFVATALIVVLTYAWGVAGTFTAQLLASVYTLGSLWLSPYRLRPVWSWQALRTVLAFAVPVFLVSGLLQTTIDSMEVFVLAHRVGVSAVGLYAWGVSMAALLLLWPNAVTNIYSTAVVRAIHADVREGGHDGAGVFLRLIVTNAFVFVALATAACLVVPFVAAVLFPKFVAAVLAAQLLIVSVYYENIRSLGFFVLTAQDRFNRYLVALAALVVLVLPVLWSVAPLGIAWLAGVAIARRMMTAHVVLHIAVRDAFASPVRFWGFCLGLYLLGLVPFAVSHAVEADLAHSGRAVAVFVLLVAGLGTALYALHRRFRVLGPLWLA